MKCSVCGNRYQPLFRPPYDPNIYLDEEYKEKIVRERLCAKCFVWAFKILCLL